MESSALNETFIQRMASLNEEQQMRLLDLHDNGCLEELLKWNEESEIKPLVQFRKEKPQILKDILSDDVSAEPVLDYIQDLEARASIFKQFHRLCNEVQGGGYLDAALFSVFMVAPIAQLEFQLQKLAAAKDSTDLPSYLLSLLTTRFGIQACSFSHLILPFAHGFLLTIARCQ
jgi:hypothetical protein